MKTSTDHPDFTAWLMGELPHDRATEMEREIAADPAMQLVAREHQEFLQQLTQWMGGSREALDARQREKILSAARRYDEASPIPLPVKRSHRGWSWISLATAALAVIGVWLGMQFPFKGGMSHLTYEDVTREIALLPSEAPGFPNDSSSAAATHTTAVGGSSVQQQKEDMSSRQPDEYMRLVAQRIANSPIPTPSELAVPRERGFVSSIRSPRAPLPLRVGTASWSWVKRSIIEHGRLPHPSLVRVEEIINAFEFRSDDMVFCQGLTMQALALPSDKSNQRKRILLGLRNGSRKPVVAEWLYQPVAGDGYRLFGFGFPSSSSTSVSTIAPGSSVVLMLELDQPTNRSDMGQVLCRVGGLEKSLTVASRGKSDSDAAFFSLLADYAQWLSNPAQSDSSLRDAMNSVESQNLSENQRTALSVIKKSLPLRENQ